MEMNNRVEMIVNEIIDKQTSRALENYKDAWEDIRFDLSLKWEEEHQALLEGLGFKDCQVDILFASSEPYLIDENGRKIPHIKVEIAKEGNTVDELIFPRDVNKDGINYGQLYNESWNFLRKVNSASVESSSHIIYKSLQEPLWKEEVTKNVLDMQDKFLNGIQFSEDPSVKEEQMLLVDKVLDNITTAEFDGETSAITIVPKTGDKIIVGPGAEQEYGFMYRALLDACSVKNPELYEEEVILGSIKTFFKYPSELNPKKQEIKSNGGTPIQTKPEDSKDLNSRNFKTMSETTKELLDSLDEKTRNRLIDKNNRKKKKIGETAIDRTLDRAEKGIKKVRYGKVVGWLYYVCWVRPERWLTRFTVQKGATMADLTGDEKDKKYQLIVTKKLAKKADKLYNDQFITQDEKRLFEEAMEKEEEETVINDEQQNPQVEVEKQQEPLLLTDDLIKDQKKEEPTIEMNNEKDSAQSLKEDVINTNEPEKAEVFQKTDTDTNVLDSEEEKFQKVRTELQNKMANGTATNEDYQKMAEVSNAYEIYKQKKNEQARKNASLHSKEAGDVFAKTWKINYAKNELLKDVDEERKTEELNRYLQENGISTFEYEAGRGFYSDELEVAKENQLKMYEEQKEAQKREALNQMIEWEKVGDPISAMAYIASKKSELGITDGEINQAYIAYDQEKRESELSGKSK